VQQTAEAVHASHEISDFEGIGLDDVELLTATQLTERLFCEWRAHRNPLGLRLEKPAENLVYLNN